MSPSDTLKVMAFVSVGALSGCAFLSGVETRTVVVIDAQGKPITGAGVFPAALMMGKPDSDVKGRLKVYVLDPTRTFELLKPGYKSARFSFDQPSRFCVLQKAGD